MVLNENKLRQIIRGTLLEWARATGEPDEMVARELTLYFENERELYEMTQALVDNLVRRMRKGTEVSEDILANSSVMDKIVKATLNKYMKDYGSFQVDTATRKATKRAIAQNLIQRAEDNFEFEQNNNEL